jgi:hypothetical protein
LGLRLASQKKLYMDSYAQFPTSGDDTLWALSASNIWNGGPEIDWPECFGGGSGNCDDTAIPNSGNGSPRPGTTSFVQLGVDISSSSVTYYQNGSQVNSESNPHPGTTWYPIVDVAADPSGGSVINGTAMLVQYMRVYKKVASGACYASIPAHETIPHTG